MTAAVILQATTSVWTALSSMLSTIILAIPSIILFIIIALIGYAIAVIVARVIKRLLPMLIKQAGLSPEIVSIIAGAVEAFIILIALAIAFSVLNLRPATV
jgi:small-conductance mechanosensitive channel